MDAITRYSWIFLLGACVLNQVHHIAAQSLYLGCPEHWESYGTSCYQFMYSETQNYAGAATACWVQGSALLSVTDYAEHQFVTRYLNKHGQQTLYQWYTSGNYIPPHNNLFGRPSTEGVVKWNGDGTFTNSSAFMSWNFDVNLVLAEGKIIYTYSAYDRQFGWGTVDDSEQLNYICEIPRKEVSRIIQQTRDFDFGSNTSDPFQQDRGPNFLSITKDTVVVGQENPVLVEFVVTGKPQPTFSWYRLSSTYGADGNRLYTQITSVAESRYTFTNGRMMVSSPETHDAGMYRCKAENKYGSVLSPPVMLSFGYLGEFSNNAPGFRTALLNKGIFLTCNSPSAKPGLSYQWYKGSAKEFIRPELNKYFFVSNNGNLYFSTVQQDDGGNYQCVVTLFAPVDEKLSTTQPPSRTSKAIELRVHGSPSQDYGPLIHNDFIAVFPKPPLVGYDVRLECFAYGWLPLQYSWSRGGKQFPPGSRFTYNNRVLTIPKAKFEDGGNYTCKVERLTGTRNVAFKSVTIHIEAKPYFVFPLRNVHADVNGELTWRCEVMAVPAASYTWYKNSELITSVPGQIEVRQNVLVISKLVKKRDEGMYQCAATNSHGTSISSAQLRIVSMKPSFIKYPLPQSTLAGEGGNLTIHCTPEAAPVPEITWFRNGSPIGQDGRITVLLDGTLHVTQITTGDQGRYECKATNIDGEARSITQVSVLQGVQFQTRPENTDGRVNTTTFLYCEASYNSRSYDIAYTWKFNGHAIDPETNYFYRLGERSGTHGLYIVNAQFFHTGVYECIIETVFTTISASAYLNILGPPGEPAGVYLENHIGSNNTIRRLVWTWNPLANHGFPVSYFEIEAQTDYTRDWEVLASNVMASYTAMPNVKDGLKHFFELHNLLPYNNYRFRVRAINDDGVGRPSLPSVTRRIPAAGPKRFPLGLEGGGGKVGMLNIWWQPVHRSEEGGPGFGYKVMWRLADPTDTTKWFEKVVGNVTKYSHNVGTDNFYLLYEAKVQTYNRLGNGPFTNIVQMYSAEGMPLSRPRNVRYNNINGTAVEITWDPVPNNRDSLKGHVVGYQIDYFPAVYGRAGPEPNITDKHRTNMNYITVYCDCGKGVVIGLQPNSFYWVNVEVLNSAGVGRPSERYKISTYEHAPGQFPQFVTVHPHGPHSARITWRGVNIAPGEASLSGYKVMWWPVSDDIRVANFTMVGKNPEAFIYALQWDLIYKLRVMGVNRGGDGKKSPTVYFTVLRGGAINVNRARFDPSTSRFLMAGSPTLHPVYMLTSLCLLIWKSFTSLAV